MNIDDSVNQIVQNIVAQITTQVQTKAMEAIQVKIAEVIAAMDSTAILSNLLNQKLDIKISQLPIDAKSIETVLTNRVGDLANSIASSVQQKSIDRATESINTQLNKIDFQQLCHTTLLAALKNRQFTFADNTIPASAVDTGSLIISGDSVVGGIVKNFGSTGIDDKANGCRLTIFDEVTVVENNLLTKDLTVKGTATIEGDLNVTGTIPESSPLFQNVVQAASNNVRTSLDQVVFKSYADMVFAQIKESGIDVSQFKLNGQDIINGQNLGPSITFSNLQRVGTLQELQVQGESFLSGTLYTTRQRVGVNTIEPAQALSVWDQEIEIGIGKKASNTAIIETPRNQVLVISSNGKNNLTLATDGSVTVNQINMGTMTFSSAAMPPSTNQPKGSVVFNSNPSVGGPMGWVSLGDAQWANFGIID